MDVPAVSSQARRDDRDQASTRIRRDPRRVSRRGGAERRRRAPRRRTGRSAAVHAVGGPALGPLGRRLVALGPDVFDHLPVYKPHMAEGLEGLGIHTCVADQIAIPEQAFAQALLELDALDLRERDLHRSPAHKAVLAYDAVVRNRIVRLEPTELRAHDRDEPEETE